MVTSLLIASLLAAEVPLGTELRGEGYVLRPPPGFVMEAMERMQGTQVGAVGARGTLEAALVDRPGDDAASLLVSLVDAPFQPSPAVRDELSEEVVRHFTDQLGLSFALERAEAVGGTASRIEVLGTVQLEGQVRDVLVAAFGGEARHAVVTFSVPSSRYEALRPELEASLDSFRVEGPPARPIFKNIAGAAAGAFAGALILSLALWRRRRLRSG